MKYTALTIGPIIKSLGLAHKTRELWAASYFFSHFMQKVIENLNKNDSIIIPYPDKGKLVTRLSIDKDKIKSAGIYPDRLILQSDKGLFDRLQTAVTHSLSQLHTEFKFTCTIGGLRNYVTAHIIEFEYSSRVLVGSEDNIIFQANDCLANCELQANYSAIDKECFLKMFEKFIEAKELYKDKFPSGFPSIFEIASRGLNTNGLELNDDNIDDNEIWKVIKNQNADFKTLHKYIAIVQADGDNISKIIASVAKSNSKKDISDFSEALTKFALLAAQKISEYQGIPVYAGGDDLLFFAPVSNENENIFELIKEIDDIFAAQVKNNFPDVTPKPSMSYGISMTYYKFPMHEALNTARELLFDKAKEHKGKNSIAFKIQKHSGQTFETILPKPLESKFTDMFKQQEGLAIHSVIYNLEKHRTILKKIINDKDKMINFFTNFYNEQEHKKKETKEFLDNVRDLLLDTFCKTKDFNKTLKQVYAQLQFIKFINNKNDD